MYTLVPASPRAALPPAMIRQNSNPTISACILSVLIARCAYLYWLWGADKRVMFGHQRCSVVAPRQRFDASLLTGKRQIAGVRSRGLGMGDRRDGVAAPYRDTRIAGTARH